MLAGTATPNNFALRMVRRRRTGELIPGEIHFEITNRCNLRCFHCYLEPYMNQAIDELSTSEVTGILDQLFENGTFDVTFSGGEPLCRPDIFTIMDHARERGLFFGLKTNGTLITEPVADKLKKLGITGVHVSLYGATLMTHERVTGIPGSYARTVRAVKLLRERNIQVAIKTSMMNCNIGEVKEMENIARQLGVAFSPDPLVFSKVGQPGSATDIRLDDDQLKTLIIERNWVPDDVDLLVSDLERHLICSAARTKCAISPQGEVFPCTTWRLPLGNLRSQSFKDIWYGEAASRIRAITVSDLPMCAGCELVNYCARCPGLVNIEKENGGISGPSSENCRLARAIKGVKEDERKTALRKPQYRVGAN
ncbi:MAG: hypothetical protein A2144_11220 [Chloroflexi bacterium RBG_16_50_9]|nr:MAG: hypothetical protein A2144_11220 [Chloroflexi bacterium RBG_16_50_9]